MKPSQVVLKCIGWNKPFSERLLPARVCAGCLGISHWLLIATGKEITFQWKVLALPPWARGHIYLVMVRHPDVM